MQSNGKLAGPKLSSHHHFCLSSLPVRVGDFYDYSQEVVGPSSLIMSRPVDSIADFYFAYSPLRVMVSGWVGDNDASFGGLIDCAKKILQSSWYNYANFGCDTAGYRSGTRTKELFIRWAAFSALLPLFENGGENEHRPWMYDVGQANSTETVDLYRSFVVVHRALRPYFYSVGNGALEGGYSSISPMTPNSTQDNNIFSFNPATYDYLLGDSVFVSPVLQANQTTQSSTFPAAGKQWVNLFNPSLVVQGGTTVILNVTLGAAPTAAFQMAGSILPLRVETDEFPQQGLMASALSELEMQQPGRDFKSELPITCFVQLTSETMRQLAASGEEQRAVIRRQLAPSIEIVYTLSTEAGSTDSYTLEARITAAGEVDQPLLLHLAAAGDELQSGFKFESARVLDSASPLSPGRALDAHSSLAELLGSRLGGVHSNSRTRTLTFKPARTDLGVRLHVEGLRFSKTDLEEETPSSVATA
jgi:hypothetical protein